MDLFHDTSGEIALLETGRQRRELHRATAQFHARTLAAPLPLDVCLSVFEADRRQPPLRHFFLEVRDAAHVRLGQPPAAVVRLLRETDPSL
jgi:hypothetical protein